MDECGRTGCLVIHGFGGNVDEVSLLVDLLKQKGFKISCPMLKGHTGRRRDLGEADYTEWIESAEDALIKLKSDCSHIILIGFSMGGLIAVNLSLKYYVDGVVTLNMPIYYWDVKKILLNIREDIRTRDFSNTRRYIESSLDKPVSALINFRILLGKTKKLIRYLDMPLFIAQALEDDTVRCKSARYIYNNAASKSKVLKYYENSGHLICQSSACKKLAADIIEFIEKL